MRMISKGMTLSSLSSSSSWWSGAGGRAYWDSMRLWKMQRSRPLSWFVSWVVCPWGDVVDVAVVDGLVAAGGVLAVAVAGLDGAAECAGEGALRRGADRAGRGVEDEGADVDGVEVRDDLAGSDNGAVGEFAELGELVDAADDLQQDPCGPAGGVAMARRAISTRARARSSARDLSGCCLASSSAMVSRALVTMAPPIGSSCPSIGDEVADRGQCQRRGGDGFGAVVAGLGVGAVAPVGQDLVELGEAHRTWLVRRGTPRRGRTTPRGRRVPGEDVDVVGGQVTGGERCSGGRHRRHRPAVMQRGAAAPTLQCPSRASRAAGEREPSLVQMPRCSQP